MKIYLIKLIEINTKMDLQECLISIDESSSIQFLGMNQHDNEANQYHYVNDHGDSQFLGSAKQGEEELNHIDQDFYQHNKSHDKYTAHHDILGHELDKDLEFQQMIGLKEHAYVDILTHSVEQDQFKNENEFSFQHLKQGKNHQMYQIFADEPRL